MTKKYILIATVLITLCVTSTSVIFAAAQINQTSNQTIIPVQTPQTNDTKIPNWISVIINELKAQLHAAQFQINNLQTDVTALKHMLHSSTSSNHTNQALPENNNFTGSNTFTKAPTFNSGIIVYGNITAPHGFCIGAC